MTDTTNDIIEKVIHAEGSTLTNDPADSGGRTEFGISEKWNPEAWADGKVTEDEARGIFFKKYVSSPKFDAVPDEHLKAQLVDFGVNSGPQVAIQKLQFILRVKQDGILGPNTLETLKTLDTRLINNQLVAERVKMLCSICVKTPSQLKFLLGWCQRALEFLQ